MSNKNWAAGLAGAASIAAAASDAQADAGHGDDLRYALRHITTYTMPGEEKPRVNNYDEFIAQQLHEFVWSMKGMDYGSRGDTSKLVEAVDWITKLYDAGYGGKAMELLFAAEQPPYFEYPELYPKQQVFMELLFNPDADAWKTPPRLVADYGPDHKKDAGQSNKETEFAPNKRRMPASPDDVFVAAVRTKKGTVLVNRYGHSIVCSASEEAIEKLAPWVVDGTAIDGEHCLKTLIDPQVRDKNQSWLIAENIKPVAHVPMDGAEAVLKTAGGAAGLATAGWIFSAVRRHRKKNPNDPQNPADDTKSPAPSR